MPRGPNLTDAKRDEIVAALAAGKTPKEVAHDLGVKPSAVYGVRRGHRKVPPDGAKPRRAPAPFTNRGLLATAAELVALYQVDAVEDTADKAGEVQLRLTAKGKRWLNLLQGVHGGGGELGWVNRLTLN